MENVTRKILFLRFFILHDSKTFTALLTNANAMRLSTCIPRAYVSVAVTICSRGAATVRTFELGYRSGEKNRQQLFSRSRKVRPTERKTINLDPNYRVVQRL